DAVSAGTGIRRTAPIGVNRDLLHIRHLDVQHFKTGFETFDRIAAGTWPELVGNESRIAEVRNRIGNKAVVDFLRVVDFLAARNSGNVDMTDLIEVVAQIARQVAIGDLNMIAVEQDLVSG